MFSKRSMLKSISLILSIISITFIGIIPAFQNQNFDNGENNLSGDETLLDLVILSPPLLTDTDEITYNYEILKGGDDLVDLVGITWEFTITELEGSLVMPEDEIYMRGESGEIEDLTPRKDSLVFSELLHESKYMLEFDAKYANGEIRNNTVISDTQSALKANINSYRVIEDANNWTHSLEIDYDLSNFYQEGNDLNNLSKFFLKKLNFDTGVYEEYLEIELLPEIGEIMEIDDLHPGDYKFWIETRIPEYVFGEEKVVKTDIDDVSIPELNIILHTSNFEYEDDKTTFDLNMTSKDSELGDVIQYESITGLKVVPYRWTDGRPRPEDMDINFKIEPGDNHNFDKGGKINISVPNMRDIHVGIAYFEIKAKKSDGETQKSYFNSKIRFVEHVWKIGEYTRKEILMGHPIDTLSIINKSSFVSKYDLKNIVIMIKRGDLVGEPLIQIQLDKKYLDSQNAYSVPIPSGHEFIDYGEEYMAYLYVNIDISSPSNQWDKSPMATRRFTVKRNEIGNNE